MSNRFSLALLVLSLLIAPAAAFAGKKGKPVPVVKASSVTIAGPVAVPGVPLNTESTPGPVCRKISKIVAEIDFTVKD